MERNNADVVAKIVNSHWVDELRGYGGNIKLANEIIANGWELSADDSQYEAHLLKLRSHLVQSTAANVDEFLLRLGLAIPGIQRGIRPPAIVLSENRGGLSSRRLREITGQLERWQDALTIGRRILPTLPDALPTAFAELLAIVEAPRNGDVLVEIRNLAVHDADRLATAAIKLLDEQEKHSTDVALTILQRLSCQRAEPLQPEIGIALIARIHIYPPSIFRDGGDPVANEILAMLKSQFSETRLNHLLLALAWTRSSLACDAFAGWATNAPSWVTSLNVPPKSYLHDAGLCLDDNLARRDLISQKCFRLKLVGESGPVTIPCRAAAKRLCPSCGGPLSFLFDFTKVDRRFFPDELSAAPQRILCCLHCACYTTTFASYRENSDGDWHDANGICDFPFNSEIEPSFRTLELSPFPPFAAAQEFDLDDASTLGGVPMWLQDSQYPECIACQRPMPFLAQYDNSPHGEEGIFYLFYCPECQISAVNYQQT